MKSSATKIIPAHDPEPWPDDGKTTGGDLFFPVSWKAIPAGMFSGLANRRRAVECVNACAGLADPAKSLKSARKKLKAAVDSTDEDECQRLAGEALALLGGAR